MHQLRLDIPTDQRPQYLRIASAMREAIKQGHLLPGDVLPPLRKLSESIGIGRLTIMSALSELVAEGWLEAKERRHYTVSQTLPTTYLTKLTAHATENNPVQQHKWTNLCPSTLKNLPDVSATLPYKYKFLSGHADLRLFPFDEFRSHALDTLKRCDPLLFGYGKPEGHPRLIKNLKAYLRQMRSIVGRQIIVTHGSQEGIFLTAKLLLKPGSEVAIEHPGYDTAWAAFTANGAKLVPIAVEKHGMDPLALEKKIRSGNIKLIYLTPLHQFPTTTTLCMPRRLQIYQLAKKYRIPILEDDYDHEFHYRCQPIAPIASQDPHGLVIYISTFSKVLFPSARIGFMAVPEAIAKPLIDLRKVITAQNDTLMQETVARWIESCGMVRHLRRMRRTYEERRNTLIRCVEEARQAGHRLEVEVPDGGMAIWLNTFKDADQVARAAKKRGVYTSPETNFLLRKPTKPPTHLRLGFANQTADEITEGFQRLLQAIKSV